MGVEVKVHPSFVLVLLWVIYQWGYSAKAGVPGIIFGSLVLAAVFVCVLAHEFAHAAVAKRNGLAVFDITLLPIGGMARIEHAALTPRTEILIALAGPLMNLLIAVALTPLVVGIVIGHSIGQTLGVVVQADELSLIGFIVYLWIANLILAVFNLLPAFPMDGGRVLRALLCTRHNRLKATQLSVLVAQFFAAFLTLAGFFTADYMLLLVSIFILVAAHLEARYTTTEAKLRKLPISQFTLWDGGGISPSVPVSLAVRGGPRDLVVTQNGVVVGMLWRRDLLRHLHHDVQVRDIMDRQFHPVDANDSVYDVHLWLAASQSPALPVVENGHYRGIFTSDRLAHVHQTISDQDWRWQRTIFTAFLNRLRFVLR
jgi:Zn-dependent protease